MPEPVSTHEQIELKHAYKTIFCSSCSYTLRVPVYCHDRFCPLCSRRRAKKIRERLFLLCNSLHETGQYRLKMITLTVPIRPDPTDQASHLVQSFRRLRRSRFWCDHVPGGAFVLEATLRPAGWHIHLHALVYSTFVPYKQLKSLWSKISGGSGVYISLLPRTAAAYYLTKYLVKPPSDAADFRPLSDALKDFRLFQPFGDWHGNMPKPERRPFPCPNCGNISWYPEWMVPRYDPRFKTWHSPRRGCKASLLSHSRDRPGTP